MGHPNPRLGGCGHRRFGGLVALVAVFVMAPVAAARPISLGEPPRVLPVREDLTSALASLDSVAHRLDVTGSISLRYRRPMSPLWVEVTDDFQAILQASGAAVATVGVADAASGLLFSAVSVEGQGYFASGNGNYERLRPEDAASIAAIAQPGRQQLRPRDLSHVGEIVDLGDEDLGGRRARHVRATLSPEFARGVARALAPANPAGDGDLDIAAMLQYAPGTLDVWIGRDGSLLRESVRLEATAMRERLGGATDLVGQRLGDAAVRFEASFVPFDVGGQVTVETPFVAAAAIAPTADDIRAVTLLYAANEAALTYAKVRGSFAGLSLSILKRLEPGITWTRRTARAHRDEVAVSVAPRLVVTRTATAAGRRYALAQPLRGSPKLRCAWRGRPCRIGQLTRFRAGARVGLARVVRQGSLGVRPRS